MKPLLAILFCTFLGIFPAVAQQVTELTGEMVDESDEGRTLISKPGWLRGLHIAGRVAPMNANQPSFDTMLPKDWLSTTACARITSMSGEHWANFRFAIPGAVKSPHARLYFSSKNEDVLAELTPETGGIIFEKGECSGDVSGAEQEFVASFWNEDSKILAGKNGKPALLLNMNIARVDQLIPSASLLQGDDPGVPLDEPECTRIDDPRALAFNYRCRVHLDPAVLQSEAAAKINFSYTRLYRGRKLKERTAIIYVGAGMGAGQ